MSIMSGRRSVMVWVTCRLCGRDFDCVEGLPAYLDRTCALCWSPETDFASGTGKGGRRRWTKARHGTVAGYRLHKRIDEPPCEPCRLALRAYNRAAQRSWRVRHPAGSVS